MTGQLTCYHCGRTEDVVWRHEYIGGRGYTWVVECRQVEPCQRRKARRELRADILTLVDRARDCLSEDRGGAEKLVERASLLAEKLGQVPSALRDLIEELDDDGTEGPQYPPNHPAGGRLW